MKQFKLLAMAFIATLGLTLTACSGDDDDFEALSPEEIGAADFYGAWKYVDEYGTEIYVFSAGRLSIYEVNNEDPTCYDDIETSSWSFNKNKMTLTANGNTVTVKSVSYSRIVFVDDEDEMILKRIDESEVPTQKYGTASGSSSELSKLYGSWKGNIDGDTFILKFTNNGKMNENVNGKDYGTVGFTFKNGELTFSDDTALESCIGSAPIVINFQTTTKIQIYKKSDPEYKYTLNKM